MRKICATNGCYKGVTGRAANQKYCGSAKNQTGCSWERTKPKDKATCTHCGELFIRRRPTQVLCGSIKNKSGCTHLLRKPTRKHTTCTMDGCNEDISHRRGGTKYCGSALDKTGCAHKANLVHQAKTRNQAWQKQKQDMKEAREAWQHKAIDKEPKGYVLIRSEPVTKTCGCCGKPFETRETTLYCGDKHDRHSCRAKVNKMYKQPYKRDDSVSDWNMY